MRTANRSPHTINDNGIPHPSPLLPCQRGFFFAKRLVVDLPAFGFLLAFVTFFRDFVDFASPRGAALLLAAVFFLVAARPVVFRLTFLVAAFL
ncbi:MAG TPA: hypothetical protein DCE55_20855, partial [Planctomycetaceae bacterium]|nr:hypothetical protein [Planctomycetaceae bacterium]